MAFSCCQQTLLVWGCLVLTTVHLVWTVCLKPATPGYAYSLSEDMASYPTDYMYEIVCIPGYTMVGSGELLCLATALWNETVPKCTPTEGQYPWWMLLLGLIGAMLAIVCVTPRVIHIFVDERHVAHLKSLKPKKGGLDVDLDKEEEDEHYAGEELPSSMDVMEKHYGDDIDMEQLQRAKGTTAF